ncbi:sequence-specific DNA binding transcription factor [Prunus dulcis]|uniref:Sequence-specific DNA binding transcription factor n=1 Tax=Prunus dulcis TaxID=3755 RepID=A0A4Y1RQT3_PRUDU|nr:sequence-specific DNA binding transcription factor [Prunus dulcis]
MHSTKDSLIVDFGGQELEDMVLNTDEALMRLRFRCAPLQGDDCTRIEGEHVLAINKSQSKSHFFDAKVEKWLHQDLKGQMVTVPSSSIMKLTGKNINVHPTVSAFLKSVKQMGLDSASSVPVMLEVEDFAVELDLNKFLEKQIEDINVSANEFRKEITIDILEGLKIIPGCVHAADNKGDIRCKVSISNAQVSHDQDQSESIAQSSGELEVNIEDEGPQAPCSSIQEEHSDFRSRLSPLAARAALALLVSSTHKHIAIGGTELFNSRDSDNMSSNTLSSEATKAHKNENETSDARKTLSAVQKGFENQNNDSHVKDSAEEIKLRASTNTRRLTRSAVQEEKDKSTMSIKQGLEESKSAHITGSISYEENVTIHERNVLRKKNDALKNKKAVTSPLHAESNIPMEESNEKPMPGDAGAIQDINVPMKTCAKDNKRRLTRSAHSSEENLIVPENYGMEKKSGGSRKKKVVSPSSDKDNTMPGEEINKKNMSGVVTRLGNIRQSEGKVSGSGGKTQGQKRKSTSCSRQELRFSPRLSI